MEDDKRDLISREISKFRDTHKVMFVFRFFFSDKMCSLQIQEPHSFNTSIMPNVSEKMNVDIEIQRCVSFPNSDEQ